MTQKAVNNAKVLYRLNISRSDVEEAHKIFTKAPFLLETLTNPVVSEEAKEVVLDKIASAILQSMKNRHRQTITQLMAVPKIWGIV